MRVLILEDEPLVARRLERLAREVLGDELRTLHAVATIDAAAAHLASDDDTVLLLDLNLGGGADGYTLLRESMAQPWSTVVVSGSVERALEAFELGVIDFIPKPFTAERLSLAFRRVRERRGSDRTRYLAVSYAGRVELVPLEDVMAVHGDDDYTSVQLTSGARRLHKRTLNELERHLPPNFHRVHRSHIVNLSHARSLVTTANGRAVRMRDGCDIPIGRSWYDSLASRMV
jgi:DNA-binding LytR/AlgR family response regulator